MAGTDGKRERKRGGGPRALAASVGRVTRPLFRRRGLADGRIAAEWETIVGPHLAAYSAPERIVWAGDRGTDGVLHLRIEHGALALEVQHLEPLVVERINRFFGYRAVASLRLIQGPLPRRPAAPKDPRPLTEAERQELEKVLDGVGDPALQERLRALGEAVKRRNRT